MKKVISVLIVIITVMSIVPAALAVGEIGAVGTTTYGAAEGIWKIPYTSIAPLGFEPTKGFKKSWGVWDSTDPYAWEQVSLQLAKLGQSKAATSLRELPILAVYAVNDGKRVRVDKTQVQALLDDLTTKVVREFQSPASFKLNGKKVSGARTLYACNIEKLTSKHTLRYVLILPDGQELGVYSRPWTKADKIQPIEGLVWVLTLKKASKKTPSTPAQPTASPKPTTTPSSQQDTGHRKPQAPVPSKPTSVEPTMAPVPPKPTATPAAGQQDTGHRKPNAPTGGQDTGHRTPSAPTPSGDNGNSDETPEFTGWRSR